MPGPICKAALCSSNLSATASEIINHLQEFSTEQQEAVIQISEKAIEKLMAVASED